MSEEELSFQGDREYPEKRDKATISVMWISLQLDKVRVIPPYAERHLQLVKVISLPTRSYIHTKAEREWAVCIVVGVIPIIGNASAVSIENAALYL